MDTWTSVDIWLRVSPEPSDAPPERWHHPVLKRLLPLALATFAVGTDSYVIAGLLPAIATDLQVSTPAAGQLVTVFALVMALSAPVMGALQLPGSDDRSHCHRGRGRDDQLRRRQHCGGHRTSGTPRQGIGLRVGRPDVGDGVGPSSRYADLPYRLAHHPVGRRRDGPRRGPRNRRWPAQGDAPRRLTGATGCARSSRAGSSRCWPSPRWSSSAPTPSTPTSAQPSRNRPTARNRCSPSSCWPGESASLNRPGFLGVSWPALGIPESFAVGFCATGVDWFSNCTGDR